MGWLEIRQLDCHPKIHHSATQHVDGATGIEFLRQPFHELRLRSRQSAVQLRKPVPLVGLGRADEREQFGGVDPVDCIEIRWLALPITELHRLVSAVIDEPLADLRLESRLVRFHDSAPYGAGPAESAAAIWCSFKVTPLASFHTMRPLAVRESSVVAAVDGELNR